MRHKLIHLLKNEAGNAILLISLAFSGMLAITGLVIDGGTLYMEKRHLQKVANAAVLSGAQELTNSEVDVSAVIDYVLLSHEEQGSLESKNINMLHKVSVDLYKEVPLAFSKLFGKESAMVKVHAAAELRTMGRAKGAAPLGIDDSIQLELYKEYKLKVDQYDVDTGNFGVLALGDPGAQTYEYNLRYGYQNEIKVNDILETQTGNIAGKTRSVIKERLDSCPYTPGELHHRDCSRVLLIPVYTPYKIATNQLQEVKITGFSYFYITKPIHPQDTTITGMFIERAGTGFEEPGTPFNGAYAIRLTE